METRGIAGGLFRGEDRNHRKSTPKIVHVDNLDSEMDNLISRSHPFLPILRRFFLRDGMTEAEKDKLASAGADMSKYLPEGNEARIRAAYEHRDPRLTATIITPYAEYHGANNSSEFTYTLRWLYRGFDTADPFDLKTDTNNRFYYLFRKFVAEGASEIPNRKYSPIDVLLLRLGASWRGYAGFCRPLLLPFLRKCLSLCV